MRAAGMALLGFLAITWCVADALLGLTISPAETVSVPALVGLSEDAAGAYAFLDVTAVYRNDDSPAGTILAQEPVAGSRRKLSGGQLPVRLTVSLGRAEAQIPALAGEDAKAAAEYCRNVVIASMDDIRRSADRLEELTAKKYWPFPTYSDMLFY